MNLEFNPNSIDAQFATLHQKLASQDAASMRMHQENAKVLSDILTQTKATNGRVTKLEIKMEGRWKYLAGGSAGATLVGTVLWEIFKRCF